MMVCLSASAQEKSAKWDTTSIVDMGNGRVLLVLESPQDTLYRTYLNQRLESSKSASTGIYQRFFENGQLMWEQSLKDGKAHGEMIFYDSAGKHMGTLLFHNDTLADTLYLNRKKQFVFGRFTYNSTVHGGMRRPDGSSNISKSEGAKSWFSMYAVKHEKEKQPEKYCEFSTDDNGYFYFTAEKGSFGIFPEYHKLEDVQSNMGAPLGRRGSGVHSTWNVTEPIKITNNFCYLSLHVHSVGYAP